MIRRSLQVSAVAVALSLWLAITPTFAFAGSMTLMGVGKPPTVASGLPLDGIATGLAKAYSTRKLLTAYAGNAVQVERASDSTTQNIGFVANVLDTTTLSTFCSGTTCSVITWYDQSGNGVNATQSTLSQAPIIYQSGAVNAINTKPALLFNSAANMFLSNASATNNPANTQWQNAVVSVDISAFGAFTGGVDGAFEWRVDQTTGNLEILNSNTASLAVSTSGISSFTGAVIENQYNSSTGSYSFWINRTAVGTGTQTTTFTSTTPFSIGTKDTSSERINGSIGELIIYDLVGGIPGASQISIENNQKAYWGTP